MNASIGSSILGGKIEHRGGNIGDSKLWNGDMSTDGVLMLGIGKPRLARGPGIEVMGPRKPAGKDG
jgi:hypothetical protein